MTTFDQKLGWWATYDPRLGLLVGTLTIAAGIAFGVAIYVRLRRRP